jgi:hypothetical protein
MMKAIIKKADFEIVIEGSEHELLSLINKLSSSPQSEPFPNTSTTAREPGLVDFGEGKEDKDIYPDADGFYRILKERPELIGKKMKELLHIIGKPYPRNRKEKMKIRARLKRANDKAKKEEIS